VGSGVLAGPCTTEPSASAKLLPWHGQLTVSAVMVLIVQPWWVQVAENATNRPAVGWVITTSASAKTFPPPTGMSDVAARAPDAGVPSEVTPGWIGPTDGRVGSSVGAARPVVYVAHPATTVAQPPHAPARTVRRDRSRMVIFLLGSFSNG
jgi:hypothetical protein